MQTYAPQLRELTLTYRIRRDVQGDAIRFGGTVAGTDDIAQVLLAILADEPSEVFGLLCVTPRQRVIGYHEVSRGQLVASNVHPRDVFRVPILANAAGVILAHYRRGTIDATPSPDDLAIAQTLVTAGELLGVTVVDYIVMAGDCYVSLLATGAV